MSSDADGEPPRLSAQLCVLARMVVGEALPAVVPAPRVPPCAGRRV